MTTPFVVPARRPFLHFFFFVGVAPDADGDTDGDTDTDPDAVGMSAAVLPNESAAISCATIATASSDVGGGDIPSRIWSSAAVVVAAGGVVGVVVALASMRGTRT
jgi:hypothetical protein